MAGSVSVIVRKETDVLPAGQGKACSCRRNASIAKTVLQIGEEAPSGAVETLDECPNFLRKRGGWAIGNNDMFKILIPKSGHRSEAALQADETIIDGGDYADRRLTRQITPV
jgi:hypothetical protein